MPTSYSNADDSQYKPANIEIDPTAGVYISGIRVIEGRVVEVHVKSLDLITGNEFKENGYGYSFGNSNDYEIDYFTTLNASNTEFIPE